MGTAHSQPGEDGEDFEYPETPWLSEETGDVDEYALAVMLCTPYTGQEPDILSATTALKAKSRRRLHSELAGIIAPNSSGNQQMDTMYEEAQAMAAYAGEFARCAEFEARSTCLAAVYQALRAQPARAAVEAGAAADGTGSPTQGGSGAAMVRQRGASTDLQVRSCVLQLLPTTLTLLRPPTQAQALAAGWKVVVANVRDARGEAMHRAFRVVNRCAPPPHPLPLRNTEH
jgi:hypothetical protein